VVPRRNRAQRGCKPAPGGFDPDCQPRRPAKPAKQESALTLRCKDGDVAVITWDTPECLENLGRLVLVRGPVHHQGGMACWRIKPVTPELYCVTEADKSITRESVTWGSGVVHQDAWMMPIRPGNKCDESISSQHVPAQSTANASTESTKKVSA